MQQEYNIDGMLLMVYAFCWMIDQINDGNVYEQNLRPVYVAD